MARSHQTSLVSTALLLLCLPALTAHAQPRVRIAQRTVASDAPEKPRSGDAAAGTELAPIPTKPSRRSEPAKDAIQLKDHTAPETLRSLPESSPGTITFDPYGIGLPGAELGLPVAAGPAGPPPPLYRFRVYGDFLMLQPGKAATTSFAVPINGAIAPPPSPPIPLGPANLVDPTYEYGFRAGIGLQLRPLAEWAATYTSFSSQASGSVSVNPAGVPVVHSLVVHPSTTAAGTEFLDATASSELELMLGDVDYRGFISDCPSQQLNYVLGGRYANLDQNFSSRFTNAVSIETVNTDITFQGGGLRVGLEGNRRSTSTGFLVYGRGLASLVAGRFTANYTQTDNFAGAVVNTSYRDDRVVPILDLEVGVGWKSPRERFLISAGYLVSAWYGIVGNSDWITAVQNTRFEDISDTLIFDGLVARGEFRF